MRRANLAGTVFWWLLQLEEMNVNSELSKRIEFLVVGVAEDVPIDLRFLWVSSVWAQMGLRWCWITNLYVLVPSTLTRPHTVTMGNLGVSLA